VAVGVACACAMAVVLPVAVTFAAGILGATVTLRRRRSLARRALAMQAAALQSALDVLTGELRVGAHPVAAFEVAAREVDGPVAESLRGVAARARLGDYGIMARRSRPAVVLGEWATGSANGAGRAR